MKTKLFSLMVALGLCVAAGSVSATVFYIDEFTVTENGQTYWQDTFSDGVPPADLVAANVDVNLYSRQYITRPQPALPGPEINGKLTLDTAQGLWNIGVVNPVPNLIQRARINSPTNSSLPAALLASEQIVVTGLFDLIEPQLNHELYSIRLTDWTDAATPQGVELAVVKNGAGDWLVQLRQAIINDQWAPIQTWALALIAGISDYEQISLSLFNDLTGGNGNEFTAEFTLFDLDGISQAQSFTSSTPGIMYAASDWLRPDFTVRVRVIPEPTTLALILIGLVCIGSRRRKGCF